MVKENCSLYIYTDGSVRGNPGNAAIAFTIYDENRKIISEKSEFIGIRTNNVAEYMALISALEEASKFCRGEIFCFSDSKLIINQIRGDYKTKKKHLKELYLELKNKENSFKIVKYARLSEKDDPKIVRVDKLAKKTSKYRG